MTLREFDSNIASKYSPSKIVGVDEAGRGPLAGPVVAAACYIPPSLYDNADLAQVNDSKKLTPAKREKLFKTIKSLPIIYCTGFATCAEIDRINILQATFEAMRRALAKFEGKDILALIDGNHTVPNLKYNQKAIIDGDALSLSIAAASIIAKVTRDKYMDILDLEYPSYNFRAHKGYGTKQHIEAIKKYGPCRQHRKTFEPVASLCFGLFGSETGARK